jgi:tRNA 5-methylaminomethyl-2-thiouridine biosynthesis bifunctional protein
MGNGLFGALAYGSRGLLWAGLAGEIIASMLEGEPLPIERKLAAALDPGRFAMRAARKSPTSAPA